MSANTTPIFTLTPDLAGVAVTAANTNSNGNGTIATDIFKVFTAGANGSYIKSVTWLATATAAGTATTATVGRVFLSSKTSGTTTGGSDTFLWFEVTLPVVTADSTSTPVYPIGIPFNFALPASWTILATNHASPAANTAWQAFAVGGDY